jgi:uncharacterized membrane protein YhaH (DUF805 family)
LTILAGVALAAGVGFLASFIVFKAGGDIGGAYVLGGILLLPLMWLTLAVQVRRCHDLGWSGTRIVVVDLIGLIPVVGWIVTLVFAILLGFADGQPCTNRYGPDPKGRNFAR